MKLAKRTLIAAILGMCATGVCIGQIDEICAEQGITPGLDSPFAHVPYVYGRVLLKGFDAGTRPPKVVVSLIEGSRAAERFTIGRAGNYCFKRQTNSGEIVVEVNGIEATRRTLAAYTSQLREDFEIVANTGERALSPGVVSAKNTYPRNERTAELYLKAQEAESEKRAEVAARIYKEIVDIDPSDHVAWAKLGSLYFEMEKLAEAEKSFRKALELRSDFTPAWVNVGMIRVAQKQFEAAIEIFKYAAELEPTAAKTFRLLGEAYLQARKGTLGAAALNHAIELDPVGMADCHLTLAHLYELAGAKPLATREYKLFLSKVPDHPERKRLEKFIRDNPE